MRINTYHHTVVHLSSHLSANQCQLWKYFFGEIILRIGSLAPGCCSSMLLQSECENVFVVHQTFLLKFILYTVNFESILDFLVGRQLSPGCYSSMFLQSEHENVCVARSIFLLKYILRIKDPRKFSTVQYLQKFSCANATHCTVAQVVLTCKWNNMICQSSSSFIGNMIMLQNLEIAAMCIIIQFKRESSISSTSQSNYCVCIVILTVTS